MRGRAARCAERAMRRAPPTDGLRDRLKRPARGSCRPPVPGTKAASCRVVRVLLPTGTQHKSAVRLR